MSQVLEGFSKIDYRVEVDTLDFDPVTGLLPQPHEDGQLPRMLLAELPFIESMQKRAESELRVVGVRLYQRAPAAPRSSQVPSWLLMYAWLPSAEWLLKRLETYRELLKGEKV